MQNLIHALKKYIPDFLVFIGGACTVYGVSMLSAPAAWILAGVELVVIAYFYERAIQ